MSESQSQLSPSPPDQPTAKANPSFRGSAAYWERRYQQGGHSGVGSRGALAEFKARTIDAFVEEVQIESVVEFGCGDGVQLQLAHYPRYIGPDVSRTALQLCIALHGSDRTKSFFLYDPETHIDNCSAFTADLGLSLDVIFHLVEDHIYDLYMHHLFAAASRYVCIYSSNQETTCRSPHVRHRKFTEWIDANATDWTLLRTVPNAYPSDDHNQGSFADFYFYQRNQP